MATKFLGGLEVSGVLTAPTPSASDNSTKIATTAFVKAQGYLSGAHTHSISDVTGLQSALDGKAAVGSFAAVNHTHAISNITGLQSALDSKQPAGSYLTEIPEEYLTQAEADGLYQPAGSYAAASHTHSISQVTGLQSALDGKQAAGSYLTSESDTLASVTGRGASTSSAVTFNGGLYAYAQPIYVNEIRFRDTSGSPQSDPYSIRWISEASERGAGLSWLEFQLNDDNNEEIRIYGNSCVGYNCGAYSDNLYHRFRADGYAWHAGNLEIGGTFSASGYNKSNWDTAYGWGNHASAGYLTSGALSGYATQSYVNNAVAAVVNSAPDTLDTLRELATALGDDPNFATTITNLIATKANASHTHAISDVSGLQSALDGKAASSHTHSISQVTGLQSALDGKQAAGSYAAASHTHGIEAITDAERWWNNFGQNHGTRTSFDAQGSALSTGFGWRYVQGAGNSPNWGNTGNGQYYALSVGLGNDYASNNYAMQIAIPRLGVNPYLSLRFEEGGSLGAWTKISAAYADSAGEVAWSGVTGKPSTFTPSSHTHSISDVTGLQSALDGKASASHSHDYVATNGSTWSPHPSSSRTAAWNTFHTDYGYIQFGPANGSWAHIYSDKSFYFNQEIYVNDQRLVRWNEVGVGVASSAIVQRDGNGYIYANHINFNTSESENPSINSFIVSNGDGWSRKATIAHVKSQLGLGSAAYASTSAFAAASHGHDYATHRDEGTNFVDYARYVYNNGAYSGSGWTEPSDLGVRYAASAGNADTLDGYHASVAGSANTIPTRNGSGYLIPENWIQLNGIYGLYSPTNNAHFRPNANSYGAWHITGTRNGWAGIEFDANNGQVNLMINPNSNTSGFHNNSYGWQMRWDDGTIYCNKSSYGGGTQAVVLDSSNYTSYAAASSHTHTWGQITDRPTNVSQFTNNAGYITSSGRAYPRRSDGEDINWNWSGQGGQPTWLWGGWDGREMYVFNPENFSVNYAANSGYSYNGAYAANAGLASNANNATNVDNGNVYTTGNNLYIKNSGVNNYRLHHNGSTGVFDVSSSFQVREMSSIWPAQRVVWGSYMSYMWLDVDPWGDNWGIGGNPTSWKSVNRGSLLTFGFEDWSDRRHKSAIVEIDNAIEKVCSISGYTYWKVGSEVREGGVIAQDVLAVFPEAVGGTEDGYSVKPAALIGLLMKAVKEQQEQISILQQRIELLENK